MKFSNINTLLFDLDGTLIDSAPDLAIASNAMLKDLGRPPFEEQRYRDWVGNGAMVMVKRALSGSTEISKDLDEALCDKALNLYLDHYLNNVCVKTTLYPGVAETLRELHQQNFRLAIVTNKPARYIEPILQALNVDDLFSLNIGGDSLPERKPNPLPLLHACEQLNTSVAQTVMIGDSKNDILAAKACNMQSVGLTYGYNYGEDIGVHKPELVLDHFSDLLKAF